MPDLPFLQYQYFGNTVGDYTMALLLAVGFVAVVSFLKSVFYTKFEKFTKRTANRFDDILAEIWRRMDKFTFLIVGVYLGLATLSFSPEIQKIIDGSAIVILTFIATRLIQFVFDSLLKTYLYPLTERSRTIDDQFVVFFRKLGDVVVWILAIIFVIANMGVNVTSLVTGLGIGGLALALGAQETISNVFAALTLLGDRPFKTGDWIVISGKEGIIKELGLRSVRMTSFDGTEIIIPSKQAANSVIENIDRRKTIRVNSVISLDNQTPVAKLRKAIKRMEDYFQKYSEKIDRYRVNFSDYNNWSLNLLVQFWVKEPKDWDKFLEVQTEVNLKLKEILEKEGVKLGKRGPKMEEPKE